MKINPSIYLFLFFVINQNIFWAQITTPVIRANFGVDAELRTNFRYNIAQFGTDDWFRSISDIASGGQFVIDTTGAFQLLNNYNNNPASLNSSFTKPMRFPAYSVINNRLLIDGYFVRDFHGNDSTMFASGSNKNGMSPQDWTCPVAQPVPDKNEILDAMLHVRRDGPNSHDSMWMFGGISIENTTGNRYFDFEMYQTDFSYDRSSQQFINYGPDAGHTSWLFDAAGNIVQAGDIIFTAEYSSSSLTLLEARIWVSQSTFSTIIPTGFNFTGSFDGSSAGAGFGYAGITPKFGGTFYTGLQSLNNTWAGPFKLVLGNNSIADNYTARQYMEFSVNLTKLGLDEDGVFSDDNCMKPFRKVLIKTRTSTSFTSSLKDFVLPFAFFVAPEANLETMTPSICSNGGVASIYVSNPLVTSIYQWNTPNGNIVGSTTGTSINVDTPGIYIVTQYLNSSCSVYAIDTITITDLGPCNILTEQNIVLQGSRNNALVQLQWQANNTPFLKHFVLEKSTDGHYYNPIYTVAPNATMQYHFNDAFTDNLILRTFFYRVVAVNRDNSTLYSRTFKLTNTQKPLYTLRANNHSRHSINVFLTSENITGGKIVLFNAKGQILQQKNIQVREGSNLFNLQTGKENEMIFIQCILPQKTLITKLLITE